MKKVYISADFHWGHNNIRRLCNRPFDTPEAHDNHIIEQINSLPDNSTLYYLGDLMFGSKEKLYKLLKSVKKSITWHIILGNHDKQLINNREEVLQKFSFIRSLDYYKEITHNGKKICMLHYPMHSFSGAFRYTYHFFGHSHGNCDPTKLHPRARDVGFDCTDYTIWSIDDHIGVIDKIIPPFTQHKFTE